MNPSFLQTLAGTWSKVLSAVSSRIGSYFTDERLQREYIVPALAFVLGCLGLLMAIVGPEAPRAWWDSLSLDLKLLALALLGLLSALFVEISRHLMLTIRRLYSGDFSRWPWLQDRLRLPYLQGHADYAREDTALREAGVHINQARDILKPIDPTQAKRATKGDYPVLRVALSAYQGVPEDGWEWKSLDNPAEGTFVATPEQLVAHYTLVPVTAGKPVPVEALAPLPAAKYVGSARETLTLDLHPGDAGPSLQAGAIVKLYLVPHPSHGGAGQPAIFGDLMVLIKPSDRQVVLAVPRWHVSQILELLPHSDLAFSRTPQPVRKPLVAVPVAKETIPAGRLVTRKQIAWRQVELDPKDVLVEKDVLNKVYWPKTQGDRRGRELTTGERFKKEDLADVPSPEWLTFPQDDKLHPRVHYFLRITKCRQVDDSIRKGDRLKVWKNDETKPLESWCYVYQVERENLGGWVKGYHIGVRDPRKFANQSHLTLTPLCKVPVLKDGHGKKRDQLVGKDDLDWPNMRANDPELRNAYLHEGEGDQCLVKSSHYYVASSRDLSVGTPIARDSLRPAIPKKWDRLELTKSKVSDRASDLKPGDLVSVSLAPADGVANPPPKVRWSGAFVHSITDNTLTVAIPEAKKMDAEAVQADDYTVKITITHSDTKRRECFLKLERDISEAEDLSALNRALSGTDADACDLKDRAEQLRDTAQTFKELHDQIEARPWVSDSGGSHNQDGSQKEKLGQKLLVWVRRRKLVQWLCESEQRPSPRRVTDKSRNTASSAQVEFRAKLARFKATLRITRDAVLQVQEHRAHAARVAMPELVNTRPTEMGNVLAAAAEYPRQAYKIDTVSILPRLIDVLEPDDRAVKRLIKTEAAMNMLLLFSFWSGVWTAGGALALLIARGPWWVYLVVLLGGTALWRVTKEAATTQAYAYGDALRSIFDLRRRRLLSELGVALEKPEMTPLEEQKVWLHLYRLLAQADGEGEGFPALNPAEPEKKG